MGIIQLYCSQIYCKPYLGIMEALMINNILKKWISHKHTINVSQEFEPETLCKSMPFSNGVDHIGHGRLFHCSYYFTRKIISLLCLHYS